MFSSPATSITELVNGAAGLVVVLSGLFAGGTRSLAILLGFPSDGVERATALGFLAGTVLAMAVLVANLFWR
jgi:hypothetical protein